MQGRMWRPLGSLQYWSCGGPPYPRILFVGHLLCCSLVCGYVVVVGCGVMYPLLEVFVICLLSLFLLSTLEYSLVGSVVLLFLSLFVCVCGYIVVVDCGVMYALLEVFVVCLLFLFVPFSFISFFFLFNCCCSYRIFCISLEAGWTVRTRPND